MKICPLHLIGFFLLFFSVFLLDSNLNYLCINIYTFFMLQKKTSFFLFSLISLYFLLFKIIYCLIIIMMLVSCVGYFLFFFFTVHSLADIADWRDLVFSYFLSVCSFVFQYVSFFNCSKIRRSLNNAGLYFSCYFLFVCLLVVVLQFYNALSLFLAKLPSLFVIIVVLVYFNFFFHSFFLSVSVSFSG